MIATALTLLGTALSLLVVDILLPGVDLATFPAALIAAAAIGAINAIVKPVIEFFALPLNVLTLGAFSLVVNGVCFLLASLAVPGFKVSGPLSFFLGPILLSAVNTFLSRYLAEKYPQMSAANPSADES